MIYKRIVGIIAIIVGMILLYFGYDISRQMDEARGKISRGKSMLPRNPITNQIEKNVKRKYYQKVDSYQIYVTLCRVGGISFIVAGGVLILISFRKKR